MLWEMAVSWESKIRWSPYALQTFSPLTLSGVHRKFGRVLRKAFLLVQSWSREREIMQSILSWHKVIKIEINNTKTHGKFPNIWKLSNTLLNNTCLQWAVKRNVKIFWTKLKWEHNLKFVGYSKNQCFEENTRHWNSLITKEENDNIDNLIFHLRKLEKKEQESPKAEK